MRFGPKESVAIAAKAMELHKAGGSWVAIAKELGVDRSWLKHWVNKAGYPRNDKTRIKASPANLLKARGLRAQGVCWKLVGRQVGVDNWRTLQRAIAFENKAARDAKQ